MQQGPIDFNTLSKLLNNVITQDDSANKIIALINQNSNAEVKFIYPDLINVSYMNNTTYANAVFFWATENGHYEIVEHLLKDPRVTPHANNNHAIGISAENGHNKVVKLLLKNKHVDPTTKKHHAIRWAAANGHDKVVKTLLKDKRVAPAADKNYAIGKASENGHNEVVKRLMANNLVDPSDHDNFAIRFATIFNRVDVVRTLLTDPRVDPVEACRIALNKGHDDIVTLLINDRRTLDFVKMNSRGTEKEPVSKDNLVDDKREIFSPQFQSNKMNAAHHSNQVASNHSNDLRASFSRLDI